MKLQRPSQERGHFDHGWLNTYHTFSFADYRDPEWMGFRSLRVINEDWVAPGRGFGTHPHRDMEIVTYLVSGRLRHEDSMGHVEVLTPGEIQRISAGSGIFHSEVNDSADEPVHLLQIWLFPAQRGVAPSYDQQRLDDAAKRGRWQAVATPDGRDGSLTIGQDAVVAVSLLAPGETLTDAVGADRHTWLQVIRGQVTANGVDLAAGDGLALSAEPELTVTATESAELLRFDLA